MTDCRSEPSVKKTTCCCKKAPAAAFTPVSAEWTSADRRGAALARLSNRFRMRYRVDPGLYALNDPDPASPVFVSANYRLSFNILRRSLAGCKAWILVLDTKGINVWCAAGKGTFGTAELVKRINAANLSAMVSHQKIIVPQLGAVGVSAHEVKKASGFSVEYGPVRAADLPAYLAAGHIATAAMRNVTFSLADRAVLTPMELFPALRKFLWVALGAFLVLGLSPQGILFAPALAGALPVCLALLAALIAGTVVTPLLLPLIPFRSFAIKGALAGAAALVPFLAFHERLFGNGWLLPAAIGLLGTAMASYLALNFTGCTTFTGMSGVKREMRVAVPAYLGASALSALLVITHKLMEWGVL